LSPMQEQRTTLRNGVLRLFIFRNDVKNQPLQQNLSQEQAQYLNAEIILLMTAPSAYMTPIQNSIYMENSV
jgi:hypothetical protein